MSPPPIEPTASVSTITNIYRPVILRPNEPGAPHFNGENVSEFLEEWVFFCDDYGCSDQLKCSRLPSYCNKDIGDNIKPVLANERTQTRSDPVPGLSVDTLGAFR